MTPETQKDVRELIRRTQELQTKALENKMTADALAASLPDVSEKIQTCVDTLHGRREVVRRQSFKTNKDNRMTTCEKIRLLPEQFRKERDKTCFSLAKELRTAGQAPNGVFASFLKVFATALLLPDKTTLFAFYKLFRFAEARALSGDNKAKEVVSGVALVLEDVAAVTYNFAPVSETDADSVQE